MKYRLRAVVIEDEPATRRLLCKKIREFSDIDIVGEEDNAEDALQVIKTTNPDILFMDIELSGGGDSFSILKQLKVQKLPVPYVVIVTAHSDYAIRTLNEYSQYVVKYIMKPFAGNESKAVFQDAVDALKIAYSDKNASNIATAYDQDEYIFIRNSEGWTKINFDDIYYIETAGDGAVTIFTGTKHRIDLTMVKCLERLPKSIKRISKTHAVNILHVTNINIADQTVSLTTIPKPLGIGDKYYKDFKDSLPIF